MRPVTADVGNDEGLGHKIGEVIGDIHTLRVIGDLHHRIEKKIPGKYPELPQNPRLSAPGEDRNSSRASRGAFAVGATPFAGRL